MLISAALPIWPSPVRLITAKTVWDLCSSVCLPLETPGLPGKRKTSWRPPISRFAALFPSSKGLNLVWSHVVKLAQSLYREAPGMEPFRPSQRTPVDNFYLAGSYTRQDYIDSMEGATMSGHLAAAEILGRPASLARKEAVASGVA